MSTVFNYIMAQLFGWVVSTDGQQRIRAGILTVVLAICAKWGLPPSIADWVANTLLGLGGTLVASFTVRQPALPPAPQSADGLPDFGPDAVARAAPAAPPAAVVPQPAPYGPQVVTPAPTAAAAPVAAGPGSGR